jgi:hypothetical protein
MSNEKSVFQKKFEDTMLGIVGNPPVPCESPSSDPEHRARVIAKTAALQAGAVSGVLALPPGPLGMVTIIPDLIVIWKIQAQLAADIAGAFGRTEPLTREQVLYCLFKHATADVAKNLGMRIGQRVVVREVSLAAIRVLLRRVGASLAQRLVARTVVRWLPIVGALGIGAYAYYDTGCVADTAMELFRGQKAETPPDAAKGKAAKKRRAKKGRKQG